MHVRNPIWLQKVGAPGAESFAILFAIESFSRSMLAAVIPLQALDLLGDSRSVSLLFFAVSWIGLAGSFLVPWLIRQSARRYVYSLGAALIVLSGGLMAQDTLPGQTAGMMARVLGTVVLTICINLYVMDNIARREITRIEPKRMFYSAGAWTVGPVLGVYLRSEVSDWAPYAVASASALIMLFYFWFLRLTDRPSFAGIADRAPSPVSNLKRFAAQPRLVLAWIIAIGRNFWWSIFFIFTPIFAVQSGLGEIVGGLIVSAGSSFLFTIPLFGWLARKFGLRRMITGGGGIAGIVTIVAALSAGLPWAAVVLLLVATLAMIAVDSAGNAPFMLSVKPGERSEMTAVFNTYRDVAEMTSPGLFSVLLRVFELPIVFVTGGAIMLAVAGLSRRMHRRLGVVKPSHSDTLAAKQT